MRLALLLTGLAVNSVAGVMTFGVGQNEITAADIVPGSIDTTKLATDAVTNVKLLNDPASLSKVTAGTMTLANASIFISTGFVGKGGSALGATGGVALEVAGVTSTTYLSVGGNNGGSGCVNPDIFYANIRNTGISWNSNGGTAIFCNTGNTGATITGAGVAGGNAAAGMWEIGATANSLTTAGVHIRSDVGSGITARTTQGYWAGVSSTSLAFIVQSTGTTKPGAVSVTFPIEDGINGTTVTIQGNNGAGYGLSVTSGIVVGNGSAGNPSLSISGVGNTGFFYDGTTWVWSGNGTPRWTYNIGGSIQSKSTGGGGMGTGTSAAAPAFYFAGDNGTGWYRPVAGNLVWSSSATPFMVLQSSGGTNPSIGSFSLTNATETIITNNQMGPTSYVLGIASNTVGPASVFGVTAGGHVVSSGTTPSIACSAGSPVLLAHSNDQSGSFTAGAAATNCTITFVNTWAQIPVCLFMTNAATPVALSVTAISATAVTVSDGVAALTGDTLYYHCWGAP